MGIQGTPAFQNCGPLIHITIQWDKAGAHCTSQHASVLSEGKVQLWPMNHTNAQSLVAYLWPTRKDTYQVTHKQWHGRKRFAAVPVKWDSQQHCLVTASLLRCSFRQRSAPHSLFLVLLTFCPEPVDAQFDTVWYCHCLYRTSIHYSREYCS